VRFVLEDSRSPSDIDQLPAQSDQFFLLLRFPHFVRPIESFHKFLPLFAPILLGATFPPRSQF